MAKTRNPAIRESEGCCIVCLSHGFAHVEIPGKTLGLDRQLCTTCHKQGYRVEQVTERGLPVPWAWNLTTPDGHVLDVSTAPKRPASRAKMKKLRAKDTYQDPGLSELFQEIRRAGDQGPKYG